MFPSPAATKQRVANAREERVQTAITIIRDEVMRVIDRNGAGRVNVAELFAHRSRNLNHYMQNSNSLSVQLGGTGVDEYMDVRTEAAQRVTLALANAGWHSRICRAEQTVYWEWPPEEGKPE